MGEKAVAKKEMPKKKRRRHGAHTFSQASHDAKWKLKINTNE